VKVTLKDGLVHEADYAFLALGRKPDLSFMGDKTDLLEKDNKGNIKVNEFTQTSINNVYLIGDANGDPMTANKARVQAKIAISHISGNKEFKYEQAKIVQPVYTSPPLANVGLTEKQAVKQGIKYQIYKTDLNNLIKNVLHPNTHGFVKVLLNEDDVIIGGSGFGYESQEVISTLALNIGRKWEESMLSKTSYAYPSWMEAFLEF
jgi:dihydrolipoamide dehydrogenase